MLRTVSVHGPTNLNMCLRNTRIPLFAHTDIASDSRMSSPLTGLPRFDEIMWIGAPRLVS